MSDIPEKQPDSKEINKNGSTSERQGPSDNAKAKIQKGVPIDDDVRLDLYDLRNRGASSEELGKMVSGLSKGKQEQVRQNAMGDGEKTSVIDKKGEEILDYPHKPVASNDDK